MDGETYGRVQNIKMAYTPYGNVQKVIADTRTESTTAGLMYWFRCFLEIACFCSTNEDTEVNCDSVLMLQLFTNLLRNK